MQKTVIVLITIIMMLIFGAALYFSFSYDKGKNDEMKVVYQNYIKTEASIVSRDGNGRVRKGMGAIWTIQFTDDTKKLQTKEIRSESFIGQENGEKVMIYYNPENPNEIIDQKSYVETME